MDGDDDRDEVWRRPGNQAAQDREPSAQEREQAAQRSGRPTRARRAHPSPRRTVPRARREGPRRRRRGVGARGRQRPAARERALADKDRAGRAGTPPGGRGVRSAGRELTAGQARRRSQAATSNEAHRKFTLVRHDQSRHMPGTPPTTTTIHGAPSAVASHRRAQPRRPGRSDRLLRSRRADRAAHAAGSGRAGPRLPARLLGGGADGAARSTPSCCTPRPTARRSSPWCWHGTRATGPRSPAPA